MCKGQSHKMPLLIVGCALMGLNRLQLFKQDWPEIYLLQNTTANPTQQILQKYSNAFQEGLSALTGFKANIIVDPSAPPKYCKPRSVPYFLRDRIPSEEKCSGGFLSWQ